MNLVDSEITETLEEIDCLKIERLFDFVDVQFYIKITDDSN